MKQRQRQWKAQRDKQRQMQKQRQRVKGGRSINRKKGNSRKMKWVKAEANAEAMKAVRADCRFVMPKLGQSKRKVRHRMKNSQQGLEKHLCYVG